MMGIAVKRSIPKLAATTTRKWYRQNQKRLKLMPCGKGKVYLFLDEFTDFYDREIGKDCIEALVKLGYEVIITDHQESGRSYISKGFLDEAKHIANENIAFFNDKIDKAAPLVGIEPSAILTFRDEYLRLADDQLAARNIANHTFTIEEFFEREIEKGNIRSDQFTKKNKTIKIHGHCQQKSLSNIKATFTMLNLPENYKATIMNTGCCGMAGSFGYEKEHYEISMTIGEDTLFPKIRNSEKQTAIIASGTSCRHQIKDGTNRIASHPISIINHALK
jgi:Fe-S oxidoreductase